MEDVGQGTCFGAGSVAGAVIGTFLTTILLLAVAALLYKQWRRHKGKHLVLVTDPEIVEDAYAFDNPCFKDATPTVGCNMDRTLSTPGDTPAKDSARWSTPWTSLGIGSTNRNDKRRTLDDSCVGPKATRVSIVSLRSHDFTGLGFNVCGNMREGIFVKDLLHRGPASESGRIHPGDRIASVKISFRNMVYEDALTILSYASPYDVELEVESGGIGSKPTTLLKKTVGPSTSRICHPLYRSQSIPELSQPHKNSTAKRLFIADPNESIGSNYSTMNSTLKSSKLTPSNQTLERRQEEAKNNHHHKIGIKVLPALDGTVHRIENQNEHNTNLERRHSKQRSDSKKLMEKPHSNVTRIISSTPDVQEEGKICQETYQQRENRHKAPKSSKRQSDITEPKDIDVTDQGGGKTVDETIDIPSEVPAEVHNAAMAARRNRKTSSEVSATIKNTPIDPKEQDGPKSPQKNKRKAPAPPKLNNSDVEAPTKPIKKMTSSPRGYESEKDDTIDTIADYTESLNDYVNKVRETTESVLPADTHRQRLDISQTAVNRRNSESDTDSEVHNSFTTIELNPADITVHRTPVPPANDDDDDDDIYRKAASLGDLSKYENKSSTPLERAQSLDMTDTIGSKKRKAPMPPEDINESTEDLTKLDQMDTFDRRKLKKSSEWGTLEDVIWSKAEIEENKKSRTRKKSNGTLERSKSAVEIKLKADVANKAEDSETSIELYNLPLSKRLTQEFIHAERMFNPDEDNSLARIVNDGTVVKSPTVDEVELDFRQAKPLPDCNDDDASREKITGKHGEDFNKALRYFELHSERSPSTADHFKINIRSDSKDISNDTSLYAGKKAVEETMTKMTINQECRACTMSGRHEDHCRHFENTGHYGKDAGRYQDLQSYKRHSKSQDLANVGSQDSSGNKQSKFGLGKSTDDQSDDFRKTTRDKEKTLYQDPQSDNSLEDYNQREQSRIIISKPDVRETGHAEESVAKISSTEAKERVDGNKKHHNPQNRRTDTDSLTSDSEQETKRTNLRMRFNSEPFNETEQVHGATDNDSVSTFQVRRTKFEQKEQETNSPKSKPLTDTSFETHFAKRVINITNNKNFDDETEEDEEYEFGSGMTSVNSKNMSSPKDDRHNISNVSVSSGENSEDSGLVRESIDYNSRDESRPPLPNTPIPNAFQKMTYITEIKVAASKESPRETGNGNEETVATTESNGDTRQLADHEVAVTSNGKTVSGKKPPVPPRRSDIVKATKESQEKQMVYVSEYKSNALRNSQIASSNLPEVQRSETEGKKFEHWIYLGDSNKEQNRCGNGSSQPQQVTNIVLSSGDEKNAPS